MCNYRQKWTISNDIKSQLAFLYAKSNLPNFYIKMPKTKTFNLIYGNKKGNLKKVVSKTTENLSQNDIHWQLSLVVRNQASLHKYYCQYGVKHYTQFFKGRQDYIVEQSYNVTDMQNYLAANIGFVVSDGLVQEDSSHGRKFLSFPINLPDHDVTYWNNFATEQVFLKRLQLRHPTTSFNPNSNDFRIKYYHSEQALITYMESNSFLSFIVKKLQEAGIGAGHKIYGVFLDIHSSIEVCPNCREALNYLMNRSANIADGFLYLLKDFFDKNGYKTSSKHALYMAIRVSSDMQHGNNVAGIVQHDEPQSENKKESKELKQSDQEMNFLERHEHREFFDDLQFHAEITRGALRQTIFRSGSGAGICFSKELEEKIFSGTISLSKLWNESSYSKFKTAIINAVPVLNLSGIPTLIAAFADGEIESDIGKNLQLDLRQ